MDLDRHAPWGCVMAGDPCPKPEPRPKARKRPLPHASAKRRSEYAERERVRRIVEKRDGWRCWAAHVGWPHTCGTIGDRQELELHETTPRGRDSKAWLNPRMCRLVCPVAHDGLTSAYGDDLRLARRLRLDVVAAPLPALPSFPKGRAR